jgi:PAS domain S-box-containing protein
MPQGQCYLWYPEILWLHVGSDTVIALSYFSISLALGYFIAKQPALPFRWLFILASALIFASGVSRAMSIWTIWQPDYGLEGVLKLVVAGIAIGVAVPLIPLLPRALALPRLAELSAASHAFADEIEVRKHTEQALQASEQRFRAIFNSTYQFTGLMSPDGTLLEVNQAALDFGGLSAEEVIGKPFWECRWWTLDAQTQRQLRAAIRRAAGGEFVRYRVDLLGQGNAVALVDFSITPVTDDAGHVVLLIPEGRDITELRQAEARAQQRLNELAHLSRLNTMGELASGLAHELNQPLTVIANNCEVALKLLAAGPDFRAKLVRNLEHTAAQALRAGDVIRRLRALVRQETGERHPVDLNRVIRETVQLIAVETRDKAATIRLALTEPLPALAIDQIQIEQVLVNLIRNGLEAMAAAASARREITIETLYPDDKTVQVTVTDTGPGLDPSRLEQIFAPFHTDKAQGMGMGLTISRSIIEAHEGRLWAEAGAGGAVFRFTLPVTTEQSYD